MINASLSVWIREDSRRASDRRAKPATNDNHLPAPRRGRPPPSRGRQEAGASPPPPRAEISQSFSVTATESWRVFRASTSGDSLGGICLQQLSLNLSCPLRPDENVPGRRANTRGFERKSCDVRSAFRGNAIHPDCKHAAKNGRGGRNKKLLFTQMPGVVFFSFSILYQYS